MSQCTLKKIIKKSWLIKNISVYKELIFYIQPIQWRTLHHMLDFYIPIRARNTFKGHLLQIPQLMTCYRDYDVRPCRFKLRMGHVFKWEQGAEPLCIIRGTYTRSREDSAVIRYCHCQLLEVDRSLKCGT